MADSVLLLYKGGMNLPWPPDRQPVMLAPMQGLTNRGLRSLFVNWVRPDVVFTEFLRVRPQSKKPLSEVNKVEAGVQYQSVPQVVQLIGRDSDALVMGAEIAQEHGARHININLGCPYGRMTGLTAGGALLRYPEELPGLLGGLREKITGSFSVKLRSGYEDDLQVLGLLPIFADTGVDFIILHPRTVLQKYTGTADHEITRLVVSRSSLPVIANGDITTVAKGRRILAETGAAGLMIGRAAIGDPVLFKRFRGEAPEQPALAERKAEIQYYLRELITRYREIFHGDAQILCKLKAVATYITDPDLEDFIRHIKRANKLSIFQQRLSDSE